MTRGPEWMGEVINVDENGEATYTVTITEENLMLEFTTTISSSTSIGSRSSTPA